MKKKRKLAFLTAISMMAACQSMNSSAFAETSELSSDNWRTYYSEADQNISENMKNWYRPQYTIENNNIQEYGKIEGHTSRNGTIIDCFKIFKDKSVLGIPRDQYINVSLSNAVAKPGQLTYIDIAYDGYTELFSFSNLITYDTKVMTLLSASISNDIPETYLSSEKDVIDFCLSRRCSISYLRNEPGNTDFSGNHTIRLCFKVFDDAPEGKYPVSISNIEYGGPTGFIRMDTYADVYYDTFYIPAKFNDGSITVSKSEESNTNLAPKSFNRTYAACDYNDSMITGDVDGNGKINVMDLITEKKVLLGTDEETINTDTNEDGKENILDLINISQYLLSK